MRSSWHFSIADFTRTLEDRLLRVASRGREWVWYIEGPFWGSEQIREQRIHGGNRD